MLSWFPPPYPDETFDSLCYRYAARMQYAYKNAVGEALFGQRIEYVAVDLPHQLAFFLQQLPPGSPLTAQAILDDHSFLPYYRPFLKATIYPQLVAHLIDAVPMAEGLGSLTRFRQYLPKYRRYCPACVTADRRRWGETYWHRQHQLPGVAVCPGHACWLENSPVYAKHRSFVQGPMTAERAMGLQANPPRPLHDSPLTHALLRLSQNAAWVLAQQPPLAAEALFPKYRWVLHDKGYLTVGNSIDRQRFLQAWQASALPALLDYLEQAAPGTCPPPAFWPQFLTARDYHHQQFAPLLHLLLIQFLQTEVATFLTRPDVWQPFGAGPWHCLNRACPHYQQAVISQCHLSQEKRGLRAEFQCACGFCYWRRGPERAPSERLAYAGVVAYGPIWEARFRELWQDPTVTLKTLQTHLGLVSLDTVKRHAVRLQLPFQAHRTLVYHPVRHELRGRKTCAALLPQRIATWRKQLLALLQAQPHLTRAHLRTQAPTLLARLVEFDADWFASTLPPSALAGPKINWHARDAALAAQLPALAETIQAEAGRPIRVTKRELGRRLGVQNLLMNCLQQLPQTTVVLAQVLESREAYALRRVRWAKEHFLRKQECPRSQWALVEKAGVEKSLFPRVLATVEEAFGEIRASVTSLSGTDAKG